MQITYASTYNDTIIESIPPNSLHKERSTSQIPIRRPLQPLNKPTLLHPNCSLSNKRVF